jgi:hypothetical protein
MSHDTLLDLSRWQWALTAAMHITFPALTVGTSVFLVVCYAMYMRTDDEVWLRMFRFWRRIFGIGFALGVVVYPDAPHGFFDVSNEEFAARPRSRRHRRCPGGTNRRWVRR